MGALFVSADSEGVSGASALLPLSLLRLNGLAETKKADFNTGLAEFTECRLRKEKPGRIAGEGFGGGEDCDESIGYDSTVYDYCQYLLFNEYHSKETGGIRGV